MHADGSEWRQRIEQEAEHFLDVSAWSVGDIAGKISSDEIQVAINLNGYTKGARNEIFALLPAPVQTSYMGFPATTGGCVSEANVHIALQRVVSVGSLATTGWSVSEINGKPCCTAVIS